MSVILANNKEENQKFDVEITEGYGEEMFCIVVTNFLVNGTKKKFGAIISEDSAHEFSRLSHLRINSNDFKDWLIGQIQLHKVHDECFFTLKHIKLTEMSIEEDIATEDFSISKNLTEIQEVMSTLSNRKELEQEAILNGTNLLSILIKGFKNIEEIVQEMTNRQNYLEKKISDCNQTNNKLHLQLKDGLRGTSKIIDILDLKIDEEVEERLKKMNQVESQLLDAMSNIEGINRSLHNFSNYQTRLMKNVQLGNEAQERTTQQIISVRRELDNLGDLRSKMQYNQRCIGVLKNMYTDILPRIQHAYVSDRRREATDAVNRLNLLTFEKMTTARDTAALNIDSQSKQ